MKDDSGSYAVLTEQGASASQMTAAKVRDIISRLPGCAGQAADAVSAYTQVKIEDAPKLVKIPKIGMCRHMDTSTTTQMTEILVRYGRPSRSSRAKSVRSSLSKTVLGTAIRQNYVGARLVESSQLGMFICSSWKKDYSYLCMWMTSKIGWKETKILIRCGKYFTNKLIWESQHHSLTMFTWYVLKDNAKQAKILYTMTEPCLNPECSQEQRKNYQARKN